MPDWSRRKFRSWFGQYIIFIPQTTNHALHEVNEAEKGDRVVLHDGVYGRQEVAHALHVAQVLVPLVIREQNLLHLLEMHVSPNLRKRRIRVRVWAVLAREQREVSVCAVDILLYRAHPV
jgi:hypothetical protein